MASAVYANAKLLLASGTLGWSQPTAVFRAMLVGPAYTFNHVQTTVADILGYEVSGGTYQRVDVGSRTVTLDLPGNRALCRASGVRFTALSGVTPAGLVIYKQIGGDDSTPGNDPLVCCVGFPTTAASGLDYLVEFDPDGVFALTQC